MRSKKIVKSFIIIFCSLFTLLLMGYHFGTFDQASHIPFLKKISDPYLYANDPFFSLIKTHPSFFWFLFIPFLQSGTLEIALFGTYLISLILTYLSIWTLAETLFDSFEISALSTIVWIIPHIGFAGFPLFEFSLVNRTLILPFALFSISLYLKKNYMLSFALAGFIMNFHALSVIYLAVLYLSDILIRRLYKNKQILLGIFTFFLTSLPVLLWSFFVFIVQINLSATPIKEWLFLISKPMMDNIFYPLHINPPYIVLTLGGFSSIQLFFYCTRSFSKHKYFITIRNFLIGIAFSIIMFIISSYLIPIELVIKTQLIRIGIFSIIFGYLYSIAHIWKEYMNDQRKKEFLFSYLILLFSVFPFLPLLYLYLKKSELKKIVILLLSVSSIIFSAWFAYSNNIWKPGINIYPRSTDYHKAQIWAKENTPKNTMFITPPYAWGIYDPEWRVFSERSTVVVLSDTLEMAFSPEYTKVWKERFEDLIPKTIEKFGFNYFENNELVKKTYLSITPERVKMIRNKYKADYFVTENKNIYPFSVVYKNNTYTIYSLATDYKDFSLQ